MELPENVFERVARLCDQWERQAGPLPPDARHLLAKMARAIVLDAAGVTAVRIKEDWPFENVNTPEDLERLAASF